MDKENTPLEEWENHKIKATLDLSGTTVKVGATVVGGVVDVGAAGIRAVAASDEQ